MNVIFSKGFPGERSGPDIPPRMVRVIDVINRTDERVVAIKQQNSKIAGNIC